MNIKKVSFGSKPTEKTKMADSWVDQRIINDADKSMKRLTIDIPLSLHTMLKTDCAERGVKIADEVRELLNHKYGNQKF